MFFGRMKSQSGNGTSVLDIDGMSGGPVYGVKKVNGDLKYWVIGIQSGWYRTQRVACFCLLAGFLLELKRILIDTNGSDDVAT